MSRTWSADENVAIVDDYFAMFLEEIEGVRINKREHSRELRRLLQDRSQSAVERKHMNISAVLRDLGQPWIDGYKPYGNYQAALRESVVEKLTHDRRFARALEAAVAAPVPEPKVDDLLGIVERAPRGGPRRGMRIVGEGVGQHSRGVPGVVDYIAREARNQALGKAGEELVLRYEEQRLCKAGRTDLARRIEHVSTTKGDGARFDVLSFETTGRERLIEVKTTRFGKRTPFYVSRSEVDYSRDMEPRYYLYRVFNFRTSPRLFTLQGALTVTCDLNPLIYKAEVA